MPYVPSSPSLAKGRRAPFTWPAALLVALVVVSSGGWRSAGPAAAAAHGRLSQAESAPVVVYHAPVIAPVTDPFRPPATPFGPGNRGIDYATVPGTAVRAAADGLVVFAGPVAGALHVTVRHGDGIRTSYSFLAAIRVLAGQRVRGGDVVGLTAAALHVGARRGDTYIDPASLWGRPVGPAEVYLVPLDGYEPGPVASGPPRAKGGGGHGTPLVGASALRPRTLPGVSGSIGPPGRP